MIRIKSKTTKIISFLALTTVLLYGQNKSSFYFNLTATEEYHSNLYRLPDSLKKADYRFNSFSRFGYEKTWPAMKKNLNIYYENRFCHYNKYQTYDRMSHILYGRGYLPVWTLGKLVVNERLRLRDYSKSRNINSLRNIFSVYLQTDVTDSLLINSGYRHWLKRYPNNSEYEDYFSNRLFFNLYYSLTKQSKIGLRNEFSWHTGNLYPYGVPKKPETNLDGFRYILEFSYNRILGEKYLLDLRYSFEWDNPQEIDNEQTGEHFGDENTEDLLAEDSDFDYIKHQFSASLLYKIVHRLSFFGLAVLQTKKFQHWRIDESRPLRSDVFGYLSLTVKYQLLENLSAEFYYNLENNQSNHYYYQYSRQITGSGLRYKF